MKNIPNILSMLRITLIPFFARQMMAGETSYAAGILILSGFTDLLDGFLARRFKWITPLGKILDPFADKLTQVAVCFILALALRRYWGFFALILFKDAVMLIIGAYFYKKGIKIESAKWFGKTATASFYTAMCLVILFPAIPNYAITLILSLALMFAFIAGFLYIPEFKKYRAQINRDTAKE
jgi:cardiolipin synthase